MGSVFQRAFEVEAATYPRAPRDGLAHPFGFDQYLTHRWRVSIDVWEALVAAAGIGDLEAPTPDVRLLGEPIEVDDTLPPDSMILERASAE